MDTTTDATTETSPRIALRDATRTHHERTEAAVDLATRVHSMDAYRTMVARFLGLHAPLEDALAGLPWAEAGLDFDARRRTPALRADLADLGVDPETVERCPDVLHPTTLAAGLGSLYVLEGASLGGQIIARDATAALGTDATRFFRGDGREVGPMWRAFGRALDTYLDTPERLGEATRAAADTFGLFERWMR